MNQTADTRTVGVFPGLEGLLPSDAHVIATRNNIT